MSLYLVCLYMIKLTGRWFGPHPTTGKMTVYRGVIMLVDNDDDEPGVDGYHI